MVEKLLMGLGILLGLCGSVMINVGNNVQALGMGLDAAQQDLDEKKRSKRPKVLWISGTVTFIVGSVINFVAFVFAAASVLAPLEAIQFDSNLVFARFVTKVPVSRKMVAGSALIVAGTIGAEDGDDLALAHRQTDAVQRMQFAAVAGEAQVQIFDGQQRRGHAHTLRGSSAS